MNWQAFSYFWSKSFLMKRRVLLILFWVNLLGTVYGYEWYWSQMVSTLAERPIWMVLFVPDSPTASLFFTLTLLYLLRDSRKGLIKPGRTIIRGTVETVGVVSSFKYGIWAVAMIVSGIANGDAVSWQDWMLSISHLGMAVEALLYARLIWITPAFLSAAAFWVLSNDMIDYGFGVFPWLPDSLYPYLGLICLFTLLLSLVSLAVFWGFRSTAGKNTMGQV